MHRERGVAAIIAYKFIKAGLWVVLALVIGVMTRLGLGADLLGLADHLRHHAGAWSLELAALLTRAATRRGLWTLVLALLADAAASTFEGWALLRGRWWGPWVVVVSTGALMPFEFVAFARHPHPVRAFIFLVNVAIVAYLARKAVREQRTRGMPEAQGAQVTPTSGDSGASPRATRR